MSRQTRNIGILAHVDAGKTTITENFLFLSGQTKQLGSVDNGTTQTDFLEVEKERGITVRSANTSFEWKGTQINLIDTPGHVDFSSDVERIMRVIDCAILIVSAVEGVQAHTETLFDALKKHNIPTILFINKVDRVGADTEKVIQEIKKELTLNIAVLQKPLNEETNEASIQLLWDKSSLAEDIIESIANIDETILEKYLEGESIPFETLNNSLKTAIQKASICPLLLGSAKNSTGIEELLDAIVQYAPSPALDPSGKLSALVYKIEYDKTMGKVAHVKVFSGSIKNRQVIKNQTQNGEEKVTQVRKLFSNKFKDIGIVETGDVAGICGFSNVKAGDVLGQANKTIPGGISLRAPLLTVQVKAGEEKNYATLAEALMQLSDEDPTLDFEWLKDEKELHVNIMGWMQIEVLEATLENRFGIKAKFNNPTVIYKETPTAKGEGFEKYWMPKPCWAITKFLIEPGERGSGIVYESKVSVDKIHQKYQNEIKKTIPKALKQGIKGWEVTDIKITLIDGEDHEIHSRPGDFIIATPMAIMNGLTNTGTTLLEPLLTFKIKAPVDLLGAITSDITQMRGSFDSPIMENNKFILEGILPVATSLDYPVKLSSRSGGKANILTKFHGYQECTDNLGVIRPYKGISPLDRSKYILKARKALQ